MTPLVLYHGARCWSGPPRLVPAKQWKRVEHGPGLYLTTDRDGARGYAKGGGKVLRFEVESNLVLLENKRISADDMIRFVESLPRLPGRKEILLDIERSVVRRGGDRQLQAGLLLNLMVNRKVAHGDNGVALAIFYVEHGIDAAEVKHAGYTGQETWYVLFNLDKIVNYGPG